MNNEKKCGKYEALFIFQNEEELLRHIEECEECRKEHEKFQKVSALIKEAGPLYTEKKRREKSGAIKKALCCLVIFLMIGGYTGYQMYDNYQLSRYDPDNSYSYVASMGLPTDDYGFLEL